MREPVPRRIPDGFLRVDRVSPVDLDLGVHARFGRESDLKRMFRGSRERVRQWQRLQLSGRPRWMDLPQKSYH